jgi:hypothetical protein
VSNQLKRDAQDELSTLQGMSGRDFDYIDAQVRGHNLALELIDRMLPNITDSDFNCRSFRALTHRVSNGCRSSANGPTAGKSYDTWRVDVVAVTNTILRGVPFDRS